MGTAKALARLHLRVTSFLVAMENASQSSMRLDLSSRKSFNELNAVLGFGLVLLYVPSQQLWSCRDGNR